MATEIVPAKGEAGLGAVSELAGVIWRACYPGIISQEQIEYMLAWMYSLNQLTKDVAAGVTYELLVVDGRRVGFVGYGPAEKPGEMKLHKLYVLPECHGQGHGQRLLRHVMDTARGRGAARVFLTVNKGNARAIAAYERAGWRRVSEMVADIGGGFVMDDYVYERALT